MSKKPQTTLAIVLASAALAIPAAAAQALEWHINSGLAGAAHTPTTLSGSLSFENAVLGKIACSAIYDFAVWNKAGVGFAAFESLAIGECSSEPACPGTFATAEDPVEVITRENAKGEKIKEAKRGTSSLPWAGEAREEGTENERLVKIDNVKLTEVAPCYSLEVPLEGTLELRPYINGAKTA